MCSNRDFMLHTIMHLWIAYIQKNNWVTANYFQKFMIISLKNSSYDFLQAMIVVQVSTSELSKLLSFMDLFYLIVDTDTYLCLSAAQNCKTVDVHTSITDVGDLDQLLMEIGMVYMDTYGCFIQSSTGSVHLARIILEPAVNKHFRVMHIFTR